MQARERERGDASEHCSASPPVPGCLLPSESVTLLYSPIVIPLDAGWRPNAGGMGAVLEGGKVDAM